LDAKSALGAVEPALAGAYGGITGAGVEGKGRKGKGIGAPLVPPPRQDPTRPAVVEVQFTGPKLGLKICLPRDFATFCPTPDASKIPILVKEVTSDEPDVVAKVKPGMVIVTLEGEAIDKLTYEAAMGKLKAAGRPVTLGFRAVSEFGAKERLWLESA
jgi:hypothetical protein